MTNFHIEFDFKGIKHSAGVSKIPLVNNLPVQWHAFNISPSISNAPNPYIFVHEPRGKQISCELFNHSTELPNSILNAIKEHCVAHNISLIS